MEVGLDFRRITRLHRGSRNRKPGLAALVGEGRHGGMLTPQAGI